MIVWATIACVPLASLVAQQAGAKPKDEVLRHVVASVQHGDFAGALTSSSEALRQVPSDYRIWTLRGVAFSGLQKRAQALTAFEHALKIAPFYLPALEGEAQLQYKEGNDDARPILLRILTLLPNDPTTQAMLAILDYRQKDCSGAVSHFQRAGGSISSQPDSLAMYGKCLATLTRYEDAVPVFEQALSLDSAKRSTRYDLALCQWNVDRSADALATLQPLLATEQSDERALELAAGVYESLGNTQNAIDLLRKAILANPKNPDAYLQFAQLMYEHGSPKIGIDFLNAGLTQLPQEARLYLVRGVLLCQLGDFTKAFDDFQAANRFDPKLSYVDAAKGIVESQVHRQTEAVAQFRAAAKEHPNEALTQYLLAEALSQQEKPDFAEEIRAATRAFQIDPKMVAAQDLLAGIYLQEGQKQQAIEHSEAALSVDPNDQQALYHLILALRGTERKAEIPALMKRMTELRQTVQSENSPQKRLRQFYELPDAKKASPSEQLP
jgi:tetratricopeptide (TPR) repeat protein